MQDSLFLLPFFSKKVRQKFHLLHIFKFLNHVSPNVWFQSRKATNVPWVIEEKDLKSCKRKEKAWIFKGFRCFRTVVVAGRFEREKKKSKNFCMYFCFFRVLWWLLALEQRHPVLKDFGVFGSRLSEVSGWAFRFATQPLALEKAGGQEEVQKKGRKKEIREDKKDYQFGIIILIT